MKPYFFYATGTAYVLSLLSVTQLVKIGSGFSRTPIVVKGINGRDVTWVNGAITNDPFPTMLDPNKFIVKKIGYPAAVFPMLDSINDGVTKTVKAIAALPPGTPFFLGGYSQGAAVMSLVLKNHLQTSSTISSRLPDLKGAVMFGNPCRQTNKTWSAFKTYTPATFSGRFDVAGSTTGGHGCFPSSYRITNTPSTWFEFVGERDANLDIITCVGDTTNGTNWAAAAGDLLTYSAGAVLSVLLSAAKQTAVQAALAVGGAGHTGYPFKPPPGFPADGPTSYQLALEYLESIADGLETAPVVVPPTQTQTWVTRRTRLRKPA